MSTSVSERFEKDVAQHQMSVVLANGVHRHLRFKRPGSSVYWFEIVTWPGSLCISGDCGTYVFSRLNDMFEFFRSDSGRINLPYWAEKCQAPDRHQGLKNFSADRFKKAVVEHVRSWWRHEEKAGQLECFQEVRRDVLSAAHDGEHAAMHAAMNFTHEGFAFQDFWDSDLTEYDYGYEWCCRAVVWAIQRFDSSEHGRAAA